jgi:TAR DNA-binding protein 43
MSEPQYVLVTDDDNEQPMEVPAEPDGTLLLSTLSAQFAGACGLKYFNASTNSHRGVRLADGRLHPPDDSWGSRLYVCVFPKNKGMKNYCILRFESFWLMDSIDRLQLSLMR